MSTARRASERETATLRAGSAPAKPGPAMAAPRPMLVAYGVLAVAASARSGVQLLTRASEAPVAYGLSACSAVIYLVAWAALRRAACSQRAARVARVLCTVELVGVIVVGAASLLLPALFGHPAVWSAFGLGYGCAPLILPIVALAWLHRMPATVVAAERAPGS